MNATKKITIALSAIVYLAGLSFFIFGYYIPAMIFYILSCGLLTFLCVQLSATMQTNVETETEINEEIRVTQQENLSLKQQIRALEQDLNDLRSHSEKLSSEADASLQTLRETYEAELEKKDILLASSNKAGDLEGFLPPLSPDEKDRETLDIISITNETIKELRPFADKVGIQIQISSMEKFLMVKANRSRLYIMFRNIIDNSIKYMNRAGVLIITISNIGDDIFIVLKDNGNGLSEDETKHIFELNYQGSNRISGNGLGLTQAKAIVDYYGGTIYAKSNIGKGMAVYIQLPTT